MNRYPLPLAPSLRCPSCGRQAALFIGIGGYPTCSSRECPEPDAATTLLSSAPARSEGKASCGPCSRGQHGCCDGNEYAVCECPHASSLPSVTPDAERPTEGEVG